MAVGSVLSRNTQDIPAQRATPDNRASKISKISAY